MHLQVLGSTRWFCFDQLQSGIGPASWTNSHSWAQVTLSQRSLLLGLDRLIKPRCEASRGLLQSQAGLESADVLRYLSHNDLSHTDTLDMQQCTNTTTRVFDIIKNFLPLGGRGRGAAYLLLGPWYSSHYFLENHKNKFVFIWHSFEIHGADTAKSVVTFDRIMDGLNFLVTSGWRTLRSQSTHSCRHPLLL